MISRLRASSGLPPQNHSGHRGRFLVCGGQGRPYARWPFFINYTGCQSRRKDDLDYSRETIRELIRQTNLERVGGELERLLKPSIRLRMRLSDEASIPVGASKFGGLPDLPPGVEWPHCTDLPPNRAAGSFLCRAWAGHSGFSTQVRLTDAVPFDAEGVLPPSGWLYFFVALQRDGFPSDGITPDCWRVLFYDGDLSALRRTPVPPVSEALRHAIGFNSDLPEGHVLPSCAAEFSLSYTLPSNPEVDMTDEESNRYNETFWDVFHGDDDAHRHQFLVMKARCKVVRARWQPSAKKRCRTNSSRSRR